MNAPRWLADEAWLRDLLHWFLDRLDEPRTRAITRRVTREKTPALFQFDADTQYRWQLIEQLATEHHVLAIAPRPLLLTAFAPTAFEQLLIVENQDSFVRLVETPPAACALLYSGGFRASAARLASGHTRFAFMPGSDAEAFHARWLDADLPAYFWGDLDFTGLGILKALRAILPQLQAWQPGYSALLERLLDGAGHSPAAGGKEGQGDPGHTGSTYADNVLLPALRATGRFVDQEAVRPGR